MTTPVEAAAARSVGTVESVSPGEVHVMLDVDAPQAIALNTGQPQRFPRINGFMLVPNEVGALVGIVTWLGIERSQYPKRTGLRDFGVVDLPFPLRRMTLVAVGTLIYRQSGENVVAELSRGIVSYPSVGDQVLVPTRDELRLLVESQGGERRVVVGKSPLDANAAVAVDPDKLFGRHLAILGNTGSGKSCTVAGLIRWSLDAAREERDRKGRNADPHARFIVLDPNGEYARAFQDIEKVRIFSIGPAPESTDEALQVPAWLWNSSEWSSFTRAAPATQRPLLMQALRNLRAGRSLSAQPDVRLAQVVRGYVSMLEQKLAEGPTGYGGSFPSRMTTGQLLGNMANDLRSYLGQGTGHDDAVSDLADLAESVASGRSFAFQGGSTGFNAFTETELTDVVQSARGGLLAALPQTTPLGGGNEDAPTQFVVGELADHLELLSNIGDWSASAQYVATLCLRVRSMLADSRMRPIVSPDQELNLVEWLTAYIGGPEGANGPLTLLDLSMVPTDVLHTVIAVIARVTFEALQRYRRMNGVELPTVIVLEEAHNFVQRRLGEDDEQSTAARLCRETFERIAREGRKFGLGLVLSSQRPAELSATVLAQCNSFWLHRLVNDRDQDLVARLVPDNLGGLLRELPSLPSQQAILLGWATSVPTLVRVLDLPEGQRPQSSDPQYWSVWVGDSGRPLDWERIADDWTN